MKKARKHEEPSAESLAEMPEIDFSQVTMRRNTYYERIQRTGIQLQLGRPRKGVKSEGTEPHSVRFPPTFWKHLERAAKKHGLTPHAALRVAVVEWMAREAG